MAVSRAFPGSSGPSPPLSSVALALTLETTAREIADMARLSDRLQELISVALLSDATRDPGHVREFQAIDRLVQHLHGVALFVSALSDAVPETWRVDAERAAGEVPLHDLALRLAGVVGPDLRAAAPSDQGGDLELFG
jgi:hypothetical protein